MYTNNVSDFSDDTLEIIWAALCSMILDIHAPEDNLTEEQFKRADMLYNIFDKEMNSRAQKKRA